VDFFNLRNPSSCTMVLRGTQALTEMSTRNLPGGGGGVKGRSPGKADKFTAICGAIYLEKMWEHRRLRTLWAFTVCYRDSFTFTFAPCM
jgi:hypothetical protein